MVPKSVIPSLNETKELVSGAELYAMGDIGPAELVRGEIVELTPAEHPHGYIEAIIAALLVMFVRKQKSGRVLTGEVGVYTERDPDTVRGMDVAFISNERLALVKSKSYLDVAPELVVEVMSPDDRWSVVHEKLEEYFDIGVQLIWVVDPRLEQVHVYHSLTNVERLTNEDSLTGARYCPVLRLLWLSYLVTDSFRVFNTFPIAWHQAKIVPHLMQVRHFCLRTAVTSAHK